ncbi:MAG TPA: N-formylglutamate amidohydrolase [Fibrobacteria bacterium]|nr:N-formylglutamate amidohydrolase [Fibrobacteria bacterium]
MLPLLVSTPHSSAQVPHWILANMLETGERPEVLKRRLLREGDPFTDEIFHIPEAAVTLNALASRYVADLNRARDEEGENGVIKFIDFSRRPFYPSGYVVSPWERELRLSLYYDPYHGAIEKTLSGGIIRFFIDGHSMEAQGPALGPDQDALRPALCVSNFGDAEGEPVDGPTSCPPAQARRIRDLLSEYLAGPISESRLTAGVRLNDPFDGGHILRKYSSPPFNVPGVMIEVNRALYLDERTLEPLSGRIQKLRKAMARLSREAI